MYNASYSARLEPWSATVSLTPILEPFRSLERFAADKMCDVARSDIQVHCVVICLADKYGMQDMLTFAVQEMCPPSWGVCRTREDLRQLVPYFWTIMKDIGENVVEAHEQLRAMVLDIAAIGFCRLQGPGMEALCRGNPSFAYSIMQTLNRLREVRSFCCTDSNRWGGQDRGCVACRPQESGEWSGVGRERIIGPTRISVLVLTHAETILVLGNPGTVCCNYPGHISEPA